jgi:predicted Zn-dependent protease
MIGQEKLFRKLEKVLDKSPADETEVVFLGSDSALTRYANSYIHQNVAESDNRIFFRTIKDGHIGVASTNSLLPENLTRTLSDSLDLGQQKAESRDWPGLPNPARYTELDTYDGDTARYTPANRAKAVKQVITAARRKGLTVAGAFSTARGEIAVLNSNGLRAYQPHTSASINIVAMSDTSSGYAAAVSRRVNDIDFGRLADRAVDKCLLSRQPKEVEPGDYEVILEPPAIAEMLEWIGYASLGSKPFLQKTSMLAGKIGKKITSEHITLYDNALDEKSMAFPFDFEGVPKRRVSFIQNGVAKGVVYDRISAKKAKVKPTGHALTPDEAGEGGWPFNLFMAPGRANREKMVSKVKRGILVTRFHYINGLIDTRNGVLTGMTRDGTFLIENGEIACGLKNLRFTDSFPRTFGSVVAISRETERVASWWSAVGCVTVPTVHLGSFRFSGKTEF